MRVVDRLISSRNLLWVLRKSLSDKQVKEKKFNAAQAVTQKEEILMWKKGQMGDK